MTGQIIEYLGRMAREMIEGCIVYSENSIALYTPDGMGNYAALWTRDFAYMAEYAGEFIPVERQKACVDYLLSRAREDGWIPDRVYADGTAIYSAGEAWLPLGLANLDNGPYAVIAADACLGRMPESEAKEQFLKWEPALSAGLAALPVGGDGLIYNSPEEPHSPYGFTDCILKTGSLFTESLLLWRAYALLGKWRSLCGLEDGGCTEKKALIEKNLLKTFSRGDGTYNAATADCKQADVWGCCMLLASGFPMREDEKRAAASWLIKNNTALVSRGQLRHTAPGEYWEKVLLFAVPQGQYQNGAYWAAAGGWYAEAVAPYAPELALETLKQARDYFSEHGIFECVNGDYRKLDKYVVSATNVYGSAKRIFG